MAATTYFTPTSLKLMREFARNNNREWFTEHKARWEAVVRDPFLHLIGDLAAPLARISKHYRADPRPHGGSMFRIYRDTRFAKDKTPYKTWLGARLYHERAPQVHAPLFYMHIQPGDSFAGGGLWHPEPPTLARVREFLIDNPAAWKKATRGKKFLETFHLGGEALSRAPQGLDPAHELIADLKRKDFVASRELSDAQITSAELAPLLIESFKGVAPLVDYLCASLDLEF
ncbi:MAG: DUF2461 domain-containing protein [Proteobacteria bacterium]|uniref:DUF2461 domain-containing protein n=1 Tax=Rudaea sp. TaxID=2136325 RepID=UPI001D51831B|nr:DUF2461 domain-containing protein [Pseudomonadota bacterium]